MIKGSPIFQGPMAFQRSPVMAPRALGLLPARVPRRLGADVTGLVAPDTKDGIIYAILGGGVSVFSSVLPESVRPITFFGGIGLASIGVIMAVNAAVGDPEVTSKTIPMDQSPFDLSKITGTILVPTRDGQAELSSMWSVFLGSPRTYKVRFTIFNPLEKKVTLLVIFRVKEDPTIGADQNTSTPYVVEVKGNSSEVVTGYQAVGGIMAGGIDAEAQLVLSDPEGNMERVLDRAKFSI